MRYLLLAILVLLLGFFAHANATSSTVFTPFDMSFSKDDFTTSGPNHEILIINKNQTATINILITNTDSIPHQISFEQPYPENLFYVLESFSFEPSTINVPPDSQEKILMHLKTKASTDVGLSSIPIFAKSDSFGMRGKSFFLVIGDKNNVTENDLEFVDHSLRESFPGPAFPNLQLPSGSFKQPNDANPWNKLGIPKYVPKGYSFQGYGLSGLVYAPVKITNMTESAEFSRSGGLYVGYEGLNSSFDLDEWLRGYVAQNEAEEILVKGLRGTLTQQEERVTTDGYKYKFPAQIVLFDESSEVFLNGNMPAGELLKVAESIVISDSPKLEPVEPVVDVSYALFKTDKEEYKIQYNITNARLEATFVDIPARAFMFIINATEDGQLSVNLPRKIIDSTRNGKDRPYFVSIGDPTVGLNRIKTEETSNNPETRIVTINFTKGLNQVQLSGTFFVENTSPWIPMNLYNSEWSPLKQWRLGVDSQDVICKNGFQLIIKARDDLPACVKPMTSEKLVQRGWASLVHPINSKLLPVRPLRVSYDEFADLLMTIKGDSIIEKQESESKITFITKMGNVEINKGLKSPTAIYTINKNPINMTNIDVVEYSKSILEDIGYTQDGTESMTSIGSPWDNTITFTQLANGVYQNSHHTTFYFTSNYTKIELGRWYENISKIGFLVSNEDAKKIAYQYMQLEIERNPDLQQRNMKAQIPTFSESLQIVDDRIAWYLDAAVGPNNHPEVDSPNYVGVLVDAMTGQVLGWDYGKSAV